MTEGDKQVNGAHELGSAGVYSSSELTGRTSAEEPYSLQLTPRGHRHFGAQTAKVSYRSAAGDCGEVAFKNRRDRRPTDRGRSQEKWPSDTDNGMDSRLTTAVPSISSLRPRASPRGSNRNTGNASGATIANHPPASSTKPPAFADRNETRPTSPPAHPRGPTPPAAGVIDRVWSLSALPMAAHLRGVRQNGLETAAPHRESQFYSAHKTSRGDSNSVCRMERRDGTTSAARYEGSKGSSQGLSS